MIDCKLSHWQPWSTCSATCGMGKRTRSRYIIQMPQNGGKPCDKLTRTQKCKDLPPCPPNHDNQNNPSAHPASRNSTKGKQNFNNGKNGGNWRTITTTTSTTPGSSMMDDEDDSKFSRLLQSGLEQPASFITNMSVIVDGPKPSTEMELIGSTSFHIRNGFIYLHNNNSGESSSLTRYATAF